MLPLRFAVVDVESTGVNPSDQVVEIASVPLVGGEVDFTKKFHRLVCPTIEIPPTASAIHHLTIHDLHQAPSWDEVVEDFVHAHRDVDIFCAHNAAYEQMFLSEHTGGRPWICSMKCSMRAFPDAPSFGNQVLRYFRNPQGLNRQLADPPHRSAPDAYVTAHLLRELLAEHDAETLIRWSEEPAMPPRLTFGKHRGKGWDDVDLSYLSWIVDKSDLDEDTKLCAKRHLDRRRAPTERATYVGVALQLIPTCLNSGDLEHWWLSSKLNRQKYGIVEGTPEYAALVDACRQRRETLRQAA